jgi:hypothetical protein
MNDGGQFLNTAKLFTKTKETQGYGESLSFSYISWLFYFVGNYD